MTSGDPPTRRRLLAAVGATALGGLAGCSSLPWPGGQNSGSEQIELTIKNVPRDDDAIAAGIMSQFRNALDDAGIDTTHEPVAATELYRDVLVDQAYDVFVIRATALREPDTLRRFLHSDFRGEVGWQNPFNFSNVTVDELLERQLHTDGREREAHLLELLELLEMASPFTVVTFPDHRNGRRTALPATERSQPNGAVGYLELLSREPNGGPWTDPLRIGFAGGGVTGTLNPIAADAGGVTPLVELLYDPLVRSVDGECVPWLAEGVSWEDGDRLRATVDLRPGVSWHDGEPLTADDVTFTVEFLGDTSLGRIDVGVPTPRFRGRQTAIASVSRIDRRTVEFAFETPSRAVATHALTLPLLPEHVWKSRAEPVGDYETEARTADNANPVGSGLLAFDGRSEDESVSFEVFDEHALLDTAPSDRPDVIDGFPQYAGIECRVAPVQGALPEMLIETEIDVTGTPLAPDIADRIRADGDATVDRSAPDTMYLIGYNVHHPQLGDPRFRTLLSRLIDREYVLEEFLGGHGSVPETRAELVGLRSDVIGDSTESTIPQFPGADGEIDADRVRRLFESEGYRYGDGELLG